MPDVISDTNGKLCVGSYHMWRLLSSPDNYSFAQVKKFILEEFFPIDTMLKIHMDMDTRTWIVQRNNSFLSRQKKNL